VGRLITTSGLALVAGLAFGVADHAVARDQTDRPGAGWFSSLLSGATSGGSREQAQDASWSGDPALPVFDTAGSEWRDSFDPSSDVVTFTFDTRQATLSPETVDNIQHAIDNYRDIALRGGWGRVPGDEILRVGISHQNVQALRERLIATGDLSAHAGISNTFDTYVEAAVRRFQTRHGLVPDGIVRGDTLRALNVPVEERLEQLRINLVRVSSMAGDLGDRYVMVNIPGAEIEAVENGVVASRHTGVVGKVDRPTPLLSSRIVEVNFNPYWHVPTSIIKRDIIPQMREEPDYLTRYNIRIYNQQGEELDPRSVDWYSDEAANYLLRQDPGDQNSLGSVRINFPNQHAVYLHDTPLQNLFGTNDRFHSSGCVRVQNVRQLVTWLLEPNGDWSRAKVDAVIRSGERVDAGLRKPAGLHFVYFTAWATADGVVNFRQDIYNRDGYGDSVAADL
jgi:L,D-transpeptidase YcbB